MNGTYWRGFWRLADPKISLASFAGIFLGACMAAADQGLAWGWLALTVAGVFCVEIAKNASGELVDYDSGTDLAITPADRSPFSGGKRVLVDKLLTREQIHALTARFFAAAIAIGMIIALWRDARVLGFGLAGIALAWCYHGGPLRLSYRGCGELAVALAYGPLVVCGTYLVQTSHLSAAVLHASGALGLLVAAFLWINQFPDYLADRQAGKNNLVVRLGLENAAAGYVLLVCAGYTWLLLTVWYYPGASGLLGGLLGAFPGIWSAWRLLQSRGITARIIPAQVASLASFLLLAVGAGLGYLLGNPG
ncbi:MAG: prenyltransferase [Halieaceae bacterium]|nr:prenyltransferase [Halieaceae bacterium]